MATDIQGRPLPDVTITIEGQLRTRSAVTDHAGSYHFSALTPGVYTINGKVQGFNATKVKTLILVGTQIQVDLEMGLEIFETITAISETPMVDRLNVTAGVTVSSEVGQEAAGENCTFYGVLNMLPGVTSDAENGDLQGVRPQINGAHFADSGVLIEGIDTTSAQFGGSRVYVPTTANAEITLESGDPGVELGRIVGAQTQVVLKTGADIFHGELLFSHQAARWHSNFKDQPPLSNGSFPAQSKDASPRRKTS